MGKFLTVKRQLNIPLENVKEWLAICNCNVYWVIPTSGTDIADIPDKTRWLLLRDIDDMYTIILPLISGDEKAYLCGSEGGVTVQTEGALNDEHIYGDFVYMDTGDDPYKLAQSAVKAAADKLGTFKVRTEKKSPDFADFLGWCTWDAFYGSVDEEKVLMGLESFKAADFPLGFMILDDGAWDTFYDNLQSIGMNPQKFTDGLHGLINKAKSEYGIKIFGVWHCFEGYWGGIKENSELAEKYRLVHNIANIRPWEEIPKTQDIYYIHPDDIGAFYEEFHSFLHTEGADMLKIDGQSALDLFTAGVMGQGNTMRKYQMGMQNSAEKYFNGNVIHCMSNSNDVAYNMLKTNCWRNSYDYAPKDMKMQQEHIYINAMNAMWSSCFALPDWDMFQSHSAGAEVHAAARAVCGGPVYICDYPGRQNFKILRKLITSDGKTLRCDEPVLPTEDSLFGDFYHEKKLLKLFNRCGKISVIGAFNCCDTEGKVCGTVSPSDDPYAVGDRFAAYFSRTGRLEVLNKNDSTDVSITKDEYELISFSPIENGVAVIGLMDKYNNSAAVMNLTFENGVFHAVIRDGGRIGFYCEHKPKEIFVCGEKVDFEYEEKSGLLIIVSDVMCENIIDIVF